MAHGELGTTLEYIRRIGTHELLRGACDGDLLARFVRDREEAAFAALVNRHGPLVYRVCRNLLHNSQDAEDAFQATFLVLARKAGSLNRNQSLSNWLFGVAYRVALKARAVRLRQARRESQGQNMDAFGTSNQVDDSASIMLAEINRLPTRYRAPITLYYLEEKTRREAAWQLGWPEGTVAIRLRRGRELLRKRLLRHGLVYSTTGLGVALSEQIAPAAVSSSLAANTIHSALALVTTGTAAGVISANAIRLANELAPVAWLTPIRAVGVLFLLATLGAGGLLGFGSMRQPEGSSEFEPSPPITYTAGLTDPQQMPPIALAADDQLPAGAIARFGAGGLRIGNSAFTLTPDEKTIVALSPEGIVRKLDARTGKLIEMKQISDRTKFFPVAQPRAQISRDGKIGTLDQCANRSGGVVTVWDLDSGKMLFRWHGPAGIRQGNYRLSPDGTQLAVAEQPEKSGDQYDLRVYDLASGQSKVVGRVDYNLYEIVFTEDGRRIYVSQTDTKNYEPLKDGGRDRRGHTFACFDVVAGKQLWKLERDGQTFAVSPDGAYLVSATSNSFFQIIYTQPGSNEPLVRHESTRDFQAHPNVETRIAADNRTLVMNHFGKIILWDFREAKTIRSFPTLKGEGMGFGLRMGPLSMDGNSLWINEGALQCWDLHAGKPRLPKPPTGLLGPIQQVLFSKDGSEIFATSWSLNSAKWDVASAKQLWFGSNQGKWLRSTEGGMVALTTESNSTTHGDGRFEVSLLEPETGKIIKSVPWAKREEQGINDLQAYSLSSVDRSLLFAHNNESRKSVGITKVDIESGRRLAHFQIPGYFGYSNTPFSPCGRLVGLGGKLYQVETGAELYAPRTATREHLATGKVSQEPFWFSPDGRLLAGRLQPDDKKLGKPRDTLGVWEVASGQLLARIPNVALVAQVVIAPDNGSIATADGWGVRIYDLLSGVQIASHLASDIACGNGANEIGVSNETLIYSPDGRKLATGHQDGSILIWKAPERKLAAKDSLTQKDAESLWVDLANDTPATARSAIEKLLQSPTMALFVLDAKFKPTPADSPTSDKPVRYLPLQGGDLRGVRALEILERIGTPAAKVQLDRWAKQKANPRLADEARFCLQRMIGW